MLFIGISVNTQSFTTGKFLGIWKGNENPSDNINVIHYSCLSVFKQKVHIIKKKIVSTAQNISMFKAIVVGT